MKSLFPLEDFGAPKKRTQVSKPTPALVEPKGPTPAEIEADRMASYEQGYKAGWDDAAQSQAADQKNIGAMFARNLQELSFTFHEAKSQVMTTLEPLLTEITSKVLPQLVAKTLGQTILEELMVFAEHAADAPIQIVIAPSGRAALDDLIDTSLTIPVEILEEQTLTDGQVYLRMGEQEKKIDMDGAIERIEKAIESVYLLNQEAMKHG
ncbi:flagellar assembly protein FliH [Pacificibacter maritimus]|uniref:Flagellar assembly protein FliH n=1 Tax=Pacificibacter maritimus TaxID=762213 RepID=A0A3N4UHJ7_9RHOB|nr:flagellar biosynthesis protein [Pacificibacter maritimus]RPE64627.1 flagellar assembly protein FliH [Pacificibacter maritimus]